MALGSALADIEAGKSANFLPTELKKKPVGLIHARPREFPPFPPSQLALNVSAAYNQLLRIAAMRQNREAAR